MDVLVVEDDPDVSHLLSRILTQRDFNVYTATDGHTAKTYIQNQQFDIILLDVMLPKKRGTAILSEIRDAGNTTPVILLTAIGTSDEVVKALNSGADDYIIKPFKVEELIARIHAVLRRSKQDTKTRNATDAIIKKGSLVLDHEAKKVWVDQKELQLTSKEYYVLKYFLENQGKVLSRDQILAHVWSIHFDVGTNVVDVYVNYLRKKLGATKENQFIETVVGMGYVMR